MEASNSIQVYLYGGRSKTICEVCRKQHEGLLGCGQGVPHMIEAIVQCGEIEKRFDTGRICCSRGWGQRLCEKEPHMLPKGSFCGMGVGWACAWGASCRKAWEGR